MTPAIRGGLCALLFLPVTAAAQDLVATRADDGTEIARIKVPEGTGWCVLWHHSVEGFEVSDCYENREGRMVLVQSHLPDFAAGLGHIPGRGRQVSDGAGGYFILNIDEPVPGDAYILRPGLASVDHRLQVGEQIVSLSAVAPRERVQIALTGDVDK
ncbi:hypothetical protein SuNHUV7_19700 (plasmid) [Pseudoseohaeicola sp. NH-UV-7]|uniref:DUF1850 domain-containing protein n=1 Tax=unclassified Sulfitobacter TaxID=196795 RepID=UPI000E0BA486|nr:DUF1850 domain-containing protein [Sulfitobacter sp. JL08]AXI56024.1 DUF1850 domain-containing protein [Sulfitobacter sp. JL08]